MKKGWRIIFGIVLVALVFGGLCCGVGLLTGAEFDRILLNLDEHYHVISYVNVFTDYMKQILQSLGRLFS